MIFVLCSAEREAEVIFTPINIASRLIAQEGRNIL